jgi:hypothetical protein
MGLTLLASPADAATKLYGDQHQVLQRLEQKHEEKSQALGLSANVEVIEVLVSSAGGWNMLVTSPKQPTCVLAVGEAWQTLWLRTPHGSTNEGRLGVPDRRAARQGRDRMSKRLSEQLSPGGDLAQSRPP